MAAEEAVALLKPSSKWKLGALIYPQFSPPFPRLFRPFFHLRYSMIPPHSPTTRNLHFSYRRKRCNLLVQIVHTIFKFLHYFIIFISTTQFPMHLLSPMLKYSSPTLTVFDRTFSQEACWTGRDKTLKRDFKGKSTRQFSLFFKVRKFYSKAKFVSTNYGMILQKLFPIIWPGEHEKFVTNDPRPF